MTASGDARSAGQRTVWLACTLSALAGMHLATRESGRGVGTVLPMVLIMGTGEVAREIVAHRTRATDDPAELARRKRWAVAGFGLLIVFFAGSFASIYLGHRLQRTVGFLLLGAAMTAFGATQGLITADLTRRARAKAPPGHDGTPVPLKLFLMILALSLSAGATFALYDEWRTRHVIETSRLIGVIMVLAVAVAMLRVVLFGRDPALDGRPDTDGD